MCAPEGKGAFQVRHTFFLIKLEAERTWKTMGEDPRASWEGGWAAKSAVRLGRPRIFHICLSMPTRRNKVNSLQGGEK